MQEHLSNINYIVSDWDGTLVDSYPLYTSAFCHVMETRFGIPADLASQFYIETAGQALTNQIKEAAEKFSSKTVQDTLDLEQEFWDFQKDAPAPPKIKGAERTLAILRENNFNVSVWSGTRTDILGAKLEQTGLGEYVDFFVGNTPGNSEEVKGTFLFAKIARYYGPVPNDLRTKTIVVGDGIGDIKAGQEVGCKTVGITKTLNESVFVEARADYILKSISELPNILI